jgi:hypothetical protein
MSYRSTQRYSADDNPSPRRGTETASESEEFEFYDEMQFYNENLFLCGAGVSPHLKCAVCLDVMRRPVQCPAGHSFCKSCIGKVLLQGKGQRVCPICRHTLLESHLVVNRGELPAQLSSVGGHMHCSYTRSLLTPSLSHSLQLCKA